MAAAFAGNYSSTYVPSFESTGGLIIGYSKNVKRFSVNRYVKWVTVTKDVGYYLKITHEMAARTANVSQWRDGQEAPMGNVSESFQYVPYVTQRYVSAFTLGQKSIKQADWPILNVHAGFMAQQAMTHRTIVAMTDLTTSGNWDGNTIAAGSITGGGAWDASSATNKYIRITFDYACQQIVLNTNGVIDPYDGSVKCLFNPDTAVQSAQTEEIRDYLKQSPFALAEVRRDVESQNGRWGLPSKLFGIDIEIEDAVYVSSNPNTAGTATRAYVWPNAKVAFLSRPGGLDGMEGIPDFSTYQFFGYEDMTVETKDDPDNRRTVGRVVNDFVGALVAPASGYLVTSVTT